MPGRTGCLGEAGGNVEDQKTDELRVGMMEIRSVQGMPLSTFRTSKPPFYTGKMVRPMSAANTLEKMVVLFRTCEAFLVVVRSYAACKMSMGVK